ncbi:ATP-dependent DNA ligase [Paenibacillus sp. 1P07SE]|uniref:ATP-dependent DNA ligase n=1 Tax=Paenibacillus sp. 1P07SE TaxID=3132209 RepID=UPI0039A4C327
MFYEPMLPVSCEAAFDDERYVFEPKIDGHRLALSMMSGVVNLYTKFRTNVTERYPELHHVPVDSRHVVLDGEVAYYNPDTGAFEFEAVMERFRLTKPARIRDGAKRLPLRYYVFDILSYDGEDVRRWPLAERQQLLSEVLTENKSYRRVLSVERTGKDLFEAVRQRGLEGVVGKRKDSLYLGRRSDDWLTVPNYQFAEVSIAAYRKSRFGWLVHMGGKPVGVVEQSVPPEIRSAFMAAARGLVLSEDRHYVYLQPQLRARIRYRSRYKSGMLRSPQFVDFLSS